MRRRPLSIRCWAPTLPPVSSSTATDGIASSGIDCSIVTQATPRRRISRSSTDLAMMTVLGRILGTAEALGLGTQGLNRARAPRTNPSA